MSLSYFVDDTDLALAVVIRRQARAEEARRRRWRRLVVAGGVCLAHLVVIGYLIHTKLTQDAPEKPPPNIQLLWLLQPRASAASGVREDDPHEEIVRQAFKAVEMLPKVDVERPNAITIDPGLALGAAIACGAGSYEYLTANGRWRCQHRPWGFVYDRYGYIILDTQENARARQADKARPSDVMAHERNTTPRNPAPYIDPNAPCLECIIRGN